MVSKVENNYENLKIASSNPIMLDAMASTIAGNDAMKKEAVISIFHDMDKEDDGDCSDGDFMEDEYRVLKDATLNEKSVFEACLVPNDSYRSDYISQAIDSISLVSTLRETRALVGFSRLLPRPQRWTVVCRKKSPAFKEEAHRLDYRVTIDR